MKITGLDNRGTEDVPFGFVYFDDDSRVIYAQGKVRPYQGSYWKTATSAHTLHAITYLNDVFPHVQWAEERI